MQFSLKSNDRFGAELPAMDSILANARRFPRLLIFLLLLGFVVQATAVQSHVHFVEQAKPLAVAHGDGHFMAAHSKAGSLPVDCPLCQEAAMAGAYVLPQAPVLPPPPAPAVWIAVAAMAAFTLLTPSLGWLSRAPPK